MLSTIPDTKTREITPFDLVVVGASLGGPAAIQTLLASIPVDFPAAIVLSVHMAFDFNPGPNWLAHKSRLPVTQAADGEILRPGIVYVPVPGYHTTVAPGPVLRLRPAGNRDRACPSADLLLESASKVYRDRLLALILSGRGSDGALGVQAVKGRGGRVLVQEPATCQAREMPVAALATGCVDFAWPLDKIAAALVAFTMVPGAARLFCVAPPRWARMR